MSKKAIQLNADIAALVNSKQQQGASFTPNEIAYIQQYVGAGGLGIGSRGALYEFYTPETIVAYMWALAYHHGFSTGSILEPSCGTGRFLQYVDHTNNYVDAYEYSKDNDTSYQIAKATYPWANITNDYFESIFYQNNKRVGTSKRYDLVIGNPPYGTFTGFYSGKAREGKHFSGNTYDQYFIWAAIQLLNKGGLCVMIIPSTFLDNSSSYEKFKDELYTQADLIDAYRLPRNVFDNTQIQTDIVIFKKR